MAAAKPKLPWNHASALSADGTAPYAPDDPLPPASPLDSRVHALCEILARVPARQVESILAGCGIIPLREHVEAVLRLSYAFPASAVMFFRWCSRSLNPSTYSWNLMVDILGKNGLFEQMWDAIRSMKQEGVLSTATFSSAFGSYCAAGRFKEAAMTFEVMDRYGVDPDVVAVNSLLSAMLCKPGHAADAAAFFDRIKSRIAPDADTFAILLEGWEKDGDLARAKSTFGEMVVRVGWKAENMSSYDAFLTTLVRGGQSDEALKFLQVMKSKSCFPGLKFFKTALDILLKHNDQANALALWDLMVTDSDLLPNLIMFNAMIALLCSNRDIDNAYRLLDSMPFYGVFPDSLTYNTIFESLIKEKRAREADRLLAEMRKNEQLPSHSNCIAAVKMFFDQYDPSAAIEVWNCMVEERISPQDDCANELLLGLRNLWRLSDARRFVEDMLDMGIELRSTTLDRLKTAFYKSGKQEHYDRISRRLKRR